MTPPAASPSSPRSPLTGADAACVPTAGERGAAQITPTSIADLKRGDGIRIRFGQNASQLAIVHDRTPAGNVRVWKFSAKRRVWKGPLRLYEGDLIGRAREFEFTKTTPLPSAYRDGARR